jgi:hypothetical protein
MDSKSREQVTVSVLSKTKNAEPKPCPSKAIALGIYYYLDSFLVDL